MKSEALGSLRPYRDDPQVISEFVQAGFGALSAGYLANAPAGKIYRAAVEAPSADFIGLLFGAG